MPGIGNYNLYLVISEDVCLGKSAFEAAAAAIPGGVDIIQMREKNKSREELLYLGKKLAGLCRENNVKFIVNDDPLLAAECGADGVHLGQDDLRNFSISAAREIIGRHKIIGISTHSCVQVQEANEMDLDYIAYGPVFFTKTKDYFVGIEEIPELLRIAQKPVVFIGGIGVNNLPELLRLGAKNIAVMRAILQAKDSAEAGRRLKEMLKEQVLGAGF